MGWLFYILTVWFFGFLISLVSGFLYLSSSFPVFFFPCLFFCVSTFLLPPQNGRLATLGNLGQGLGNNGWHPGTRDLRLGGKDLGFWYFWIFGIWVFGNWAGQCVRRFFLFLFRCVLVRFGFPSHILTFTFFFMFFLCDSSCCLLCERSHVAFWQGKTGLCAFLCCISSYAFIFSSFLMIFILIRTDSENVTTFAQGHRNSLRCLIVPLFWFLGFPDPSQ